MIKKILLALLLISSASFASTVINPNVPSTANSNTYEGKQTIDVTDTEAFLIRENADGGDVFTVNTSSNRTTVGNTGTSFVNSGVVQNSIFSIVDNEQNSNINPFRIEKWSNSGNAQFLQQRSRISGSTLQALQNGDIIGQDNYQGNDGTDYDSSAIIRAIVDDTVADNSIPAGFTFLTQKFGGTSPLASLLIKSYGGIQSTPQALSAGAPTNFVATSPSHTGMTSATEVISTNFNNSATRTWLPGAITTQREALFQAPTYAFGAASTITNAATLAVTAAPVAGTNATITNPISIWAQAGVARLDGGVKFSASGSTLDTYNTGTFTPVVTGPATVPVYSTKTGRYTRIGRMIFVDILLTGDGGSEGGGSGQIAISLPFTASASTPANMIFPAGYAQNSTAEMMVYGYITASSTTIGLNYFNAIGTTASITGDLQNNATRNIRLKFSYEI